MTLIMGASLRIFSFFCIDFGFKYNRKYISISGKAIYKDQNFPQIFSIETFQNKSENCRLSYKNNFFLLNSLR